MGEGWNRLGGTQRLALRLGVLVLAAVMLGLPFNGLFKYVLVLAMVVAVFAGMVRTQLKRWLAAVAVAAGVLAAHIFAPAPRIDEGFNVFLPGPGIDKTLPADVVRALTAQFNAQYPPEKRCNDPARGCWRPEGYAGGFSFSADGIYDPSPLSRRVLDIGFSDPVDLRIGEINEIIYNWPDNASDIKRFERDRKSLNLFDRFRVTFPIFLVHRFPADFAGSNLCWRGTVLWPGAGERYETITHRDVACRTLRAEDAGRSIFSASILLTPKLTMSLHSTLKVQLQRALEFGLTLLGVLAIGLLLVRVERRRVVLPVTLIALTVLLTVVVDWQFIGGFRPLDAGDDGYTHEGFSRHIIRNLLAGDIMGALRGQEAIYYFAPALRYWRTLEHFLFGDTFLGYFSVILFLPFLVLALARRFLPIRWAIAFVVIFVAIPIGTAFGSSLVDYVTWASRGFADPLGFALLFAGLILVIPRANEAPDTGRAFFGALLLAMATFCRPNFLLASGTMIIAGVLMAITQRRFARAAVLLIGFAALSVSPLHNYVFGRSLLPFTDNVGHVDIFLMSPLDYVRAANELVRLEFAGEYLRRALVQLASWLSGAHRVMAAIPIHAAAMLILAYVALLGRRYDPWLRIVALATLLQHGIGICYLNNARYNLGTWLLTALVATVWLVSVIEHLQPETRARLAQWPGVQHAKAWFARLEQTFGFGRPT
jgi:hypothetical protein